MLTVNDVNKEYISVYEASRRLGVTPPHLYKLINTGRIPTYTRGITERKYVEWNEIQALFSMRPAENETAEQ